MKKKLIFCIMAILLAVLSVLPMITYAQEPSKGDKRFAWEIATNELTYLRTYSTKDFPHPTDPTKRIRIESTALFHAFTDKGFEDIYRELPNYDFPEGKELASKLDRYYIMDLPSWSTPVVEDSGNILRILDRRGTSIYIYSSPIVVSKGDWPFMVKDVKGNVVKHSMGIKEDLGIGQTLEIMPTVDKATFEVIGNKMYFKLPEVIKNTYPLQAYDDVNTTSTNNKDNSIEKANPDGEYGANAFIYIQRSDALDYVNRTIMDWTLSASGGCWNITAIDLYLYCYFATAEGAAASVHELTQAFVELQSSWNHYNDPAHWATAGGDYSATVVDSSNTDLNDWQRWTLLGAGATNPISGLTWGTNFNILIKYVVENAGGVYEYAVWRSKESVATPANKPYIQITYDVCTVPSLATIEETDVSYTTVTLNGNITATGGINSTIRGFEYGEISGALNLDTHTHGDYGLGTYSIGVGLTADTLYYYRAYATNTCGTGYGLEGNFTTLAYVPPTVGSQSSTVNSGCSVTFLGNVTVIGAGATTIDERGFEWGNTSGVYPYEWHEHGSWGIGNFTYTWTSADDDTTYFWRATAVNDKLLRGNGTEGNFTTNAVSSPTVLTVDPVTDITPVTALAHGEVTDYGDPCEMITLRGFEWGLVSGVYTGNQTEAGSWPIGTFDLTITGLPFGTLIYYRAMAYNNHLLGYGVEGNFTTTLHPLPCAPTDLVVTQTGVGNITITWTNGCYANSTIIRISSEGCPADLTDGYLVYYGNTTNTAYYSGLELNHNTYCIRAWSENAAWNSTTYAETKIGGGSMVFLVLATIVGILSFMAIKGRWFGFNLMAGVAWVGMFAYIKSNPPLGIEEGSNVQTIFLLLCFGMVAMVVLAGLRRGVSSSRSSEGYSMGEQFGKWHLPEWTKGEGTRQRDKKQRRRDSLDDYQAQFHRALNPGEHKSGWRNR